MSDEKVLHPFELLTNLANEWNMNVFSEEFSSELDKRALWPHYRERFHYPKAKDLSKGMSVS